MTETIESKKAVNLSAILREYWPPIVAFLVLLVVLPLTTPGVNYPHEPTKLEVAAHYLGHIINSVWVGVGLLLLVIPSLAALKKGKHDDWAWYALDAIALDFLFLDALCRRFIPWPRPNHPDLPGFPSGHATFAFLMAWMIWRRFPKLGPAWFAMATTIGWSRYQVAAHFPYQIIVGAILGCTLGALVVESPAGILLPRVLLPPSILMKRLQKASMARAAR